MKNLADPPSPYIKDGKMTRFCPSRGFILDLVEEGGGEDGKMGRWEDGDLERP